MDTVIHLNVESLTDTFVRGLKEQYGTAEIELRLKKRPEIWMNIQQFWDVIALLDWSKSGDDDAVIEPVVAVLAAMPVGNIHQFQDILSEKLWNLDTRAHALAINPDEDSISADGFLYDRCAVVANGRSFYQAVLKNPEKFPKGLEFGKLLSVADLAYERKTGEEFQHVPKFNYETGSNIAGWNKAQA